MSLSQLYLLAKKIHRLSLLAMVLLTMLMGGTGLFLKYPSWAKVLPINLGLVRYVHREISVWFVIVLLLMMITGLIMYLAPEIIKSRRPNQPPNTN